ncbi:MAG: hypothetical protein VYC60_02085 [Candidatus Thermoplasmatota archaeon]|nr:hypothetical protein [Candidatus Thermoplasmatota archaeon]|tara:strand:+ start:302 stop:538 length:237 start_codon:yes stop_codon:yes gene_type:complete
MPLLECNIDARGKAYRLRLGFRLLIIGIIISVIFFLAGVKPGLAWLAPAGAIAGGAFAMFEGRTGWCVARAMGFRTPI